MSDKIREEAYYLWEQAGKPANMDEHFWRVAEEKFRNENSNRRSRGTIVQFDGKELTIEGWSKVSGNPPSTIRTRLKRGELPEKAIYSKSLRQKTVRQDILTSNLN